MSEDTATTEFSVYQDVTMSDGHRVRVETKNGDDLHVKMVSTLGTAHQFIGTTFDLDKIADAGVSVLDTYRTIDSEWRD